ncbi:MAG: HEAT repeat domain-containing protein [Candidatus Odinarchaeota archaeon]
MSTKELVLNPVIWFHKQRTLRKLVISLKEGDTRTRETAAVILGQVGGRKAEQALITALQDISLPVRRAAVRSLKQTGTFLADLAIPLLQRGELLEREAVAWALGELEDQSHIDPLIRSLHDNFRLVRESAAKSLVKIGKPAMEKTVTYLENKSDQLTDEELLILLRVLRRFEPEKEQLSRIEPLFLALLLTGDATREILMETKELLRRIH